MTTSPDPSPPPPRVQNPIAGTTIDTMPRTLGIHPPSNSVEGKSRSPPSPISGQKAKQAPQDSESLPRSKSMDQEPASRSSEGLGYSGGRDHVEPADQGEQANFMTHSAPMPIPMRPQLAFRGEGSMRAGTQTLIQALQAIPWQDDPDNLDETPNQYGLSDSEGEGVPQQNAPISSSIHALYRPIARSRRNTPIPHSSLPSGSYFPNILPTVEDPEDVELAEESEEADGPADFEEPAFHHLAATTPAISTPYPRVLAELPPPPLKRAMPTRQESLATVRKSRRARLADKLKEIFEIEEIDEVVAEMPCWLLRSVLLQGYMYLTNSHLCFFAHLPSREDQVLKSGTLHKKTQRTRRWVKKWFVLKNDALSWYQSSSDPYFPHGVADLRYAISCEPVAEKNIRLRTNRKVVSLAADSTPSRDEWVKAIRKVIFKSQNLGESVKIAIPYPVILEVERSNAMEFSETIEVKVVDKDVDFSIESYFFAYFHDLGAALTQIRQILEAYHLDPETQHTATVKDTTSRKFSADVPEATQGRLGNQQATKSASSFRMPSILKSLSGGDSSTSYKAKPPGMPVPTDASGSSFEDLKRLSTTSTSRIPPNIDRPLSSDCAESGISSSSYDHSYPPPPSPPSTGKHIPPESSTSSWNVTVPSWLKGSSLKMFTSRETLHATPGGDEVHISEVYTPSREHHRIDRDAQDFDVIDSEPLTTPGISTPVEEKFRSTFAVDSKEELLGYAHGYLLRVFPVSGRFFISTSFLCFRSSQALIKTRMMIPIKDIIAAQQCKAFQFSCYGLLVVIKGHEELFFEFSSAERRKLCIDLLEQQMEESRSRARQGITNEDDGKRDAIILEELEPSTLLSDADPRPAPETLMESLPAVMFTSTSSTFLSFKPQESLRFTFLTIGSRGDVQPYIALGKGLMEDGHKVKIATHEEYREWIEAHGIDFANVGGDPAELMRICVENGMFTVSFLKETLQKFRGWLDDLLKSSWEACQGTDVLVESPSAMGGIHIAEALKIPYFRAFTMPWTRTRAYPHAFAVPEHKMGGGYNYMSYVMFDQVFWRATSGQINRWRRDLLGIPPTSLDKMSQHKVPFLYNFSPAVVPPPLDWYEWIRVTGYWFLDDADVSSKKWTPPPELLKFIDDAHSRKKKVVYIGFGSIVVSDPAAMTQCIIEAIAESGVYAVLSKGWSDRLHVKKGLEEEMGKNKLPPEIYEISSIPHDWLFTRIDAACHHGGAGTTGASLRAGIPTIIKPFFGDQFFWSDRVEALGVGSSVRKLTVDNLAAALLAATTDIKQIDRAKLLGKTIRAENGVKVGVEAIYRDLEYARTLAKQATGEEDEETASRPQRQPSPHSKGDNPDSHSESLTSSSGSKDCAPSDDWSVISDEEKQASPGRSRSRSKRKAAAKPLHVLQNALSSATSHISNVL